MFEKKRQSVTAYVRQKNKMFYIQESFYEGNRRKQKWHNTKLDATDENVAAAYELRNQAIRWRESMLYGLSSVGEIDGSTPLITVADIFLKYKEQNVQPNTYESYKAMIHGKIKEILGNKRIGEISTIDVEFFLNLLSAEDLSLEYIKKFRTVLNQIFRLARKAGAMTDNIMTDVAMPKTAKREKPSDIFTLEEIEIIREALNDNIYKMPTLLCLFLGLRPSEALGMRFSAIDFENDTITVCHKAVKAKKGSPGEKDGVLAMDELKTSSSYRTLPLYSEAKKMLQDEMKRQVMNKRLAGSSYNYDWDGYVCVDALGNIFKEDTVAKNFQKVLQQNNIRKRRLYDLRHTAASMLLQDGEEMFNVSRWMGHSDIRTTVNTYGHIDAKALQKTANRLNSIFSGKNHPPLFEVIPGGKNNA